MPAINYYSYKGAIIGESMNGAEMSYRTTPRVPLLPPMSPARPKALTCGPPTEWHLFENWLER
jgi:hypothetical protein